ncbi:MAG: cytochrome C [Acidobacteria bacterium]|nr:cytochrome C [Acidobacteriota bacterium]
MRSLLGGLWSAILAAAVVGCGTGCNTVNQPTPAIAGSTNDPATPEFYTGHVQPIFKKYCYRCHGGLNHRGGLTLSTRAGLLRGGESGQVIVPGDAANSLLVKLIRHEGTKKTPGPMPSKSAKLADADIETVERWVQAGALMPPDPPVK